MGRPALHVHVRLGVDIEIITTHFKSKLLTFPGVRFSPHDEAERGRFAAYALYGRSAEATTVRAAATALLTSHPQRAVVVLGDLNDVGGVRPPLRSSTGRPARRLVPPALTAPTTVTRNGCGTSPAHPCHATI